MRTPGKILAILFCVQALSLFSYFRNAIEPFPPESYDQAVYLTQVYEITRDYDRYGLIHLLAVPFSGAAQGVLVLFEGAALEIALRCGRLSPLLLNVLALFLAETALFFTVLRLASRLGLALAALGLFLSANSLWFWAGGLFDFRIDWLASCLFGVWVCLVLRSNVFDDRRWTIASAIAAAFLILSRFITLTYVLGVESVLVAIFAVSAIWISTGRRLLNCAIAMALTLVAILPFVIGSLTQIYNYYVIGHLKGSEKQIRAAESGVSSLWDNLLYYPTSIVRDHIGSGFGSVLLVFTTAVCFLAIRRSLGVRPRWLCPYPVLFLTEMLFLAGTIVTPVVILTTDQAKSPVVGGIVVVPIIVSLILLPRWIGLTQADGSSRRSYTISISGALCFGLGLLLSLDANATSRPVAMRHDLLEWSRLITDVSQDALEHGNDRPKIFFNALTSHFFASAFSAYAYEKTGSLILFNPVLNDSIFAPDPDWVMERLGTADYVVLSTADKIGVYPVLGVLTALDPKVKDWAEHHLRLAWSYTFDGGNVDVYVRP